MLNGVVSAVVIALCMITSGNSFAQSETQKGPRAQTADALPAWIVSCSNANSAGAFNCTMEQTLFVSSSGQRLLAMKLVRNPSDRAQVVATLSLPHGILLDEGATFWVDDGAKSVATISHADASGSYATFQLEPKLADALRRGKVFNISAKSLDGEDFVFGLSLVGFSAVYDILMGAKP
ncbi:Invasion protein B, involved in pathogenesis [Hoeflea sp. IMCC20628]|uniref:invasion associated locus B family protein n=1 Tax=Hoeflea sp. IMCC20628 TaxID=1620421 RepID=UPI00063AEE4F|nr:invasion associated locus B family protein [Hoeflea sp. IMCC20628]AKI00511.1 Invasion protein B, involved in pathogenesis [Hoeflea sp. IMCC20628]